MLEHAFAGVMSCRRPAMRKLPSTFVTTLAGMAAILVGACGGKGNGPPLVGIALTPNAIGVVDNVASGVDGAWYAYGDSVGPSANATSTDFSDSDCAKAGFTADQCSTIAAPTPGQPFVPDPVKGMCTNGTAALVIDSNGTPDYSAIYGAGIALDFNNPGGDAGAAKGYFDMTPYLGIGFDFTGDMIPNRAMRVSFPFNGETAGRTPFWEGGTMPSSPLTNGTHVEIRWADVAPATYLEPGIAPLDETQVASIQFQVYTNTTATTPFSYCVNNLTLLTAL
jgi:hypothetical protein